MDDVEMSGNQRIFTVMHSLATLDGGVGVRELAAAVGLSRSTVNRILLGLTSSGLAMGSPSGTYTVGPRFRVLTAGLHEHHPLLAAASTLAPIAEQAGATVIIAVHDTPRPQVTVVAGHQHSGPVKYLLEPGTVLPLHTGATGRAILGRLGLGALGDGPLEAITPETVTDRQQLEDLLAKDRKAGFTISVGQQIPLAAGVAAPFQFAGLTGAVSFTRPRYLTSDEQLGQFGPVVRTAVTALEKAWDSAPKSLDQRVVEYPSGATALERVARLLTALIRSGTGIPSGSDLARIIGANISTTNKLVSDALACGIVLKDEGMLRPGPRLLHWSAKLGPAFERRTMVDGILKDLAAATGETIGFVELDSNGTATMSKVVDGVHSLHYRLATGVTVPLHAGAAGKAILAHLPTAQFNELNLEEWTERTPTDRAGLTTELDLIRNQGWSVGDGERIPDAYGVGAPYFINGVVAGSITATIARFRIAEIDMDELVAAVRAATQRMTRLLSVE